MKSIGDLAGAGADCAARKGVGEEQWSEAITVSVPVTNQEKEFNNIKARLRCAVQELKRGQKREAKDVRSAQTKAVRHRRRAE
jgi:hypothetical protein